MEKIVFTVNFLSDSKETSWSTLETISRIRALLYDRSKDFPLKDKNFDWYAFVHVEKD